MKSLLPDIYTANHFVSDVQKEGRGLGLPCTSFSYYAQIWAAA